MGGLGGVWDGFLSVWSDFLDPFIAVGTVVASSIAWYFARRVKKQQEEQDRTLHETASSTKETVTQLEIQSHAITEQGARLEAQSDEIKEQTRKLEEQGDEIRELARDISRSVVTREEADVAADSQESSDVAADSQESSDAGESVQAPAPIPANKADLVETLRQAGAPLDWAHLRWQRKVNPLQPRGNLGWFVDDGQPGPRQRWFVHAGRARTARVAIPRDALAAWEAEARLSPTAIRLDYRTGSGKGRHAWYVETYDHRRWRITERRTAGTGYNVTEIEPAD